MAGRRRRGIRGAVVAAGVTATLALGTAFGSGEDQPVSSADPLKPLLDYRPPVASLVTDREGRGVAQFFVQRRRLVPVDEVPPHVIEAFVAAEDARFFEHGGIDFAAILRAAWANLRGGRIEQGASTITQQVVKNVVLTPERTWTRKLREMLLALEVERRLGKREILETYLNHIYLGNGSYGIADAARSYFGKAVADLDLSEAALLAGLPQRPTAYSPVRHPAAAETRRRYVLGRMLELGFVTPAAHADALVRPPRIRSQTLGTQAPDFAATFVEEVRRELVDWLGAEYLYGGGLTIETTLDLDLQREAHESLAVGLEAVDQRQGWRGPERHVRYEEWDAALREIARENGWSGPGLPVDLAEERTPWLGLVLENRTDLRGRELARIALAPDVVVHAELEPAAWGIEPEEPGPDSRLLQPGDVARFRLEPLPGSGRAVLYQEPRVEGALVSLDVHTGHVLAMVGGYDFHRSEFNRAVQARRQPGSAFKPFVYAAAIEAGYTQASWVLDAPNVFWDPARQATWRPRNYGRRFLGWLTLRRALARSVNNATIHVAQRVGIERVIAMARRLGVTSDLPASLGLALGNAEVSLLEMTQAYAAFPAGGRPVRPRLLRRVLDRQGRVLHDFATGTGLVRGPEDDSTGWDAGEEDPARSVVSPQVARIVTDLLRGAIHEPDATGRGAQRLGGAVGGKTGTTNGNRDAWFVGFSPDIATGVWVGHDSPIPLGAGETGGRAALPIWTDYMDAVIASSPPRDFALPEGIVLTRVDSRTGRMARGAGSPRATWQAFAVGTEPPPASPARREIRSARRELIRDVF